MGTNGRKACLLCGGDITAKNRSTFCSKDCANEFRIKTDASYVRFRVFERDKGVCAGCAVDVFQNTRRTPRARGTGDLWQADHIVPVIEGGGECGLRITAPFARLAIKGKRLLWRSVVQGNVRIKAKRFCFWAERRKGCRTWYIDGRRGN